MQPLINAETLFPKLVKGYLESLRDVSVAEEYRMPPAAVLTIGEELVALATIFARPIVLVGVRNYRQTHPKTMMLDVVVTLSVNLGGTAPAPVETENSWVAKIRHALSDLEGFRNYLISMPEEERTGWVVKTFRVSEGATVQDAKNKTRDRVTMGKANVLASEMEQ